MPKSIQIDEVFEISSELLEDVQSVKLTLWRTRDDFEAAYFSRSESLYDGFGVNPKQSIASNATTGSKDAAHFLFESKSPRMSLQNAAKKDIDHSKNHEDAIPQIFGQCEIKVKSITKKSYTSDWFKMQVAPEVAAQEQGLKKNEVIGKILISS